MNIIIVGGGKLGSMLIEYLAKEGHNISLIDTNYKLIESMVGKYDVLGICGNGANIETLKEAGVAKTDILISVTSSDEVNVLTALVGKKLGARHTVARVRAPEYSKQLLFMRSELGIGMAVNPELETAREISRILRSMHTVKIESFARGRADLVEIPMAEDSPFVGLKLSELYKKFKLKILICAVQRGEEVYIPDGNFKIEAGDVVEITASHSDINEMFSLLGYEKQKVRSVFIVGGGMIAYYLARDLAEIGIKVKIVEMSEKRCTELSEMLPKADVICGNGTDDTLLNEEQLDQFDACIALTGIDEENIIIALTAKFRKIPYVISKVNNTSFLRIMNKDSLDNIVSPKAISANHIVRYVRSKQSDIYGAVQNLYKFVEGKVEAVEFVVREESACTGTPLRELKRKPGILIACIVRNGKVIIPGGDDTIEKNDNVVVVSSGLYLRNLDEIIG
ncbi:MAG: Trk system potassium transporter TrkA [Clostridia bacterium]|nr:Trk system potassium transporter TrkA [Clostridia bacterium]MBO4428916.1 Trk system potassium transporter TrkA [Clostridia bacterium]